MRTVSTYIFAAIISLGAGIVVAPTASLGADLPAAVPAIGQERVSTVGMTNSLRFTPDTIVVRAGDTVLWRNTSDVAHTVTADPGRASDPGNVRLPQGASPFHSGMLQPGNQFRHTFSVPGEYVYFCVPHEQMGMIGRIIVEP